VANDRMRIPQDSAYFHAIGLAAVAFARLEWDAVWCCERLQAGYITTLRHTMYTRITKTGGRQYLQLVESFRNDRGKVRTCGSLPTSGASTRLTPERLDPLINGLNRALGRTPRIPPPRSSRRPAAALAMSLRSTNSGGTSGFRQGAQPRVRSSRREIDAEALDRAMVFNRLCEPDSKLGCLRWLERSPCRRCPRA
jgi:hypothetical protein